MSLLLSSLQKSSNLKISGNPDNSQSVSFNHSFDQLQTKMNCDLLNKENDTINASLQNLSPMIKLWSKFSLHSDMLSPFVSSFFRIMSMLRSRKQHWIHLNSCVIYKMLLLSLENVILICTNSRM